MAVNSESPIQYHKEFVQKIFRQKEQFHRDRARLPIEEKLRILVELQKIALTIRPKQGDGDRRFVWHIE